MQGAFEQIISTSTDQLATISLSAETRKADNHEIKWRHHIDYTASDVTLSNLKIGDVVGEGGFSIVKWAQHVYTKEVFALKIMNKKTVAERKQVLHVNNERKILGEISHPFVLSLIKAFSDTCKIYMVFEFLPGGELFTRILKSKGGLPPSHASFYSACIVEALDYLHRKGIVYRDLKLENSVIDSSGYVKLVDFGFAKQLQEGVLTRTLCGTPDYLAPECVMRRGHNHLVDCWSFGVLLYEMLTQFSPFADQNRVKVFQNIMKGVKHVDWNELARPFRSTLDQLVATGTLEAEMIKTINKEFTDIQHLLYKVWEEDLMARASTTVIKAHPYFKSFDWGNLREMKIPAPWKPDLSSESDLSCFDVDSFKNVTVSDELYTGDQGVFVGF